MTDDKSALAVVNAGLNGQNLSFVICYLSFERASGELR